MEKSALGRAASIGFVTSSAFPDSTPDDRLAMDLLARGAATARPAVWDAPDVDWSEFDLIVLRSMWDYHLKPAAFLDWVDRVSQVTTLWNPADLVRWNSHKRYLLDLARRGTEIVPTELVAQGSDGDLDAICRARGWSEVIVKPSVGANSHRLRRVRPAEMKAGADHLRTLLRSGDALVQPYLSAAETLGERSLVFFEGTFSHAVGMEFAISGAPRKPVPLHAEPREVARAQDVVRGLPIVPLYARLDFLPNGDGVWLLGELELIEPELFLRVDPAAPHRFAEAIERRAGGKVHGAGSLRDL